MNFHEMTDEALALVSADFDAMRARAHAPGGIDGRCFDCDARPHTWYRVDCI